MKPTESWKRINGLEISEIEPIITMIRLRPHMRPQKLGYNTNV